MSIVKKIKELCQEKGTSIPKLEKEMGFGNGAVYYWDTSVPSIDRVQKVADHFGVTIDSLVREEAVKCNCHVNPKKSQSTLQ